jgi:hypothetical protein
MLWPTHPERSRPAARPTHDPRGRLLAAHEGAGTIRRVSMTVKATRDGSAVSRYPAPPCPPAPTATATSPTS